ncbi:MAG: hypothetical protein HQ553_03645 [Chloroflexi bacterium]|nr:hypothetical protein [Chloroflexota bacterium]
MAHKVSAEILNNTTECPDDFACLKKKGFPRCPVIQDLQQIGVFITAMKEGICPYRFGFGSGEICRCPTMYEIYMRYKT